MRPPLFVFSHPNHELAVLGHLQRLRPRLLYLTDGGGPERVAQTRAVLGRLGLLGGARFLLHAEEGFYAALLARDVGFFRGVADQVAASVEALAPPAVYGDAVEHYNPTHDLTLPLLLCALAGRPEVALHEVALVYQRPGGDEQRAPRYVLQRFPPPPGSDEESLALTPEELRTKCDARAAAYPSLVEQMGGLLSTADDPHVALEVTRRVPRGARARLPAPDGRRVLRYEWRGRLRAARGEVAEPITFDGHMRPVLSGLGIDVAELLPEGA